MDPYEAGHKAGGIDERLAGHDKHFAAINGSLERMAGELAGVKMALARLADSADAGLARLADAADADRRTVVTTATALKAAEDARRTAGADRWSPWQKVFAGIAAVAALAGIVALILANT